MSPLVQTTPPTIYAHSSEAMPEIVDNSVKLLMGGSVHLGQAADWRPYACLYTLVYIEEGLRVLRDDGVFVTLQTNAYEKGRFVCRYVNLYRMLMHGGYRLVDERVWKRRQADHFQVPFSHVHIWAPPGGTITRRQLNAQGGTDWFAGIWDYTQRKGGSQNSWPWELCTMLIKATTEVGDLVVDPFAGHARLLWKAQRLARSGVGYEIDDGILDDLRENGANVITP